MDETYFKIKVYKIWSPLGNRIYLGSTENELNIRFNHHVQNYKKDFGCSSKLVFMFYGIENCKIELLGEHMVNSKAEQRKIERLYYEMYRLDCVNKNRAYITEVERSEQMKKLGKEWYEKNKKYKIHKSLSNYYKKREEKCTCEICGKEVCKLTLKSHQNSLKCKNSNNVIHIDDINQNEPQMNHI
jgi:hypothetical protein